MVNGWLNSCMPGGVATARGGQRRQRRKPALAAESRGRRLLRLGSFGRLLDGGDIGTNKPDRPEILPRACAAFASSHRAPQTQPLVARRGIAASRDCAHRRPLSDAAGGGDASLDDRTIYASLAGRLPT
jgi:hypothetical protein